MLKQTNQLRPPCTPVPILELGRSEPAVSCDFAVPRPLAPSCHRTYQEDQPLRGTGSIHFSRGSGEVQPRSSCILSGLVVWVVVSRDEYILRFVLLLSVHDRAVSISVGLTCSNHAIG
jgi:hypothetical protein